MTPSQAVLQRGWLRAGMFTQILLDRLGSSPITARFFSSTMLPSKEIRNISLAWLFIPTCTTRISTSSGLTSVLNAVPKLWE